MKLIFDIETNGFLESVTTLHCLVLKDIETGTVYSCTNHPYTREGVTVLPLADGLQMLGTADLLVGHNVIKYDLPVLQKLYGLVVDERRVIDTLVDARLLWPRDHLRPQDFSLVKTGRMPGRHAGNHSLEAFGYRLGLQKGEYVDDMAQRGITDPWTAWCPEMQQYCELDVDVTEALYRKIESILPARQPAMVREVERDVQFIVAGMERYGFGFDEKAAHTLHAQLVQEHSALEGTLVSLFEPWIAPDVTSSKDEDGKRHTTPKVKTIKRTATFRKGPQCVACVPTVYPEGATYTPVKAVTFNPSSRDHIADRLQKVRGWEPDEFTEDGKPKVDEEILSDLAYPEAKQLTRYLLLDKRIGQLAEGKEAWLKHVRGGSIYGSVNTIGAVTRRATHSSPNISQVPKVGSAFGAECRALFIARTMHKVLVGADLSGIELRMLAHYMSRWDGGAYAKAVCEGTQAEGTDVHTVNCLALGLEPAKVYHVNGKQVKGRDLAKTFIYALLYGAGDAKIAKILGVSLKDAKRIKANFFAKLPALGKLVDAVKAKAVSQRYLIGLDGGRIMVRSAHSALNTLLQSAGAIVAKHWLVEARHAYTAKGWIHGEHYGLCAWVHDEIQAEVNEDIAHAFGVTTVEAIAAAGQKLQLRVPVTGEFKLGRNWKETH